MKGNVMKKPFAIVASCLLLAGSVVLAAPSEADQKWIAAVQKMIQDGQSKISTPSEERVELLKAWAAKQGLASSVTKSQNGFTIELQKKVVKN
jgi:hypothetical protein